jgi:hypothetical protein
MKTYQETRRELERELAGYKITLRRRNPDKETARELYGRIRNLQSRLS